MVTDIFTVAVGVLPSDGWHPGAGTTANSSTGRAPRGNENGPAAWGAARAGGAAIKEALTEASTASVSLACVAAGPAFPSGKTECTLAARLALAGWSLCRAELAVGGAGCAAMRWDHSTVPMRDLAGADAFADRAGAAS